MSKVYTFANEGYEVEVVRKDDVIASIENNIVDKEIAYEIINQLEIDASTMLSSGRWVGIPKIGNIRANPFGYKAMSAQDKALVADAKKVLPHDKYLMFRKQTIIKNNKRVKINRFFSYTLSMSIAKNKSLYKRFKLLRGEAWTNIYFYAMFNAKAVSNDWLIFEEEHDRTEVNDR